MRSQARLGVTLGALLSTLAFAPARAQSHTEVWAGLSFGLLDGVGVGVGVWVGIGLTRCHYAHAGGVSVATGTSRNPDYGIYSNDDRGRRSGDYRYGGGLHDRSDADYCWDRAWDLRWGNRYH